MKKYLEFIVIGAQKSGTTSLFKYLQDHPRIFIPAAKEAPYFTENAYLDLGFDWYLAEFFGNADPDQLWGTVTPSYMANLDAARRIHETIPDVKLIALLRNPIDRAMSQYQMAYKRGVEDRRIADAFEKLLQPESIISARKIRDFTRVSEKHCYLVWGEYGRIIQHYRQYFPANRLHISFFDDLDLRPSQMIDGVLKFLGLEAGYRPSILGKKYFRGGTRSRISWLTNVVEEHSARIPPRYRSALMLWLEILNTVPNENNNIQIPTELRNKLQEFFRPDIRVFEKISGRKVPWKEFI